MERVNIVVLMSLAAALGLVGLRLVSPTAAPDLTMVPSDSTGNGFGPAGLRDRRLPPGQVGLSGGREGEKPGPHVPPPPGEERPPAAGKGITSASGASADLIAGVERRRAVLDAAHASGSAGSATTGADGWRENVEAARTGAVPPVHASGHDVNLPPADENKRHTFDFVEPPKEGTKDDVLLSLPLKGEVAPEVGGGAIQADGLVSKGGQIEFPDNAQLSFPVGNNVNSKAGTISFEVQPQWAGADQTNNALVSIRDEHVWENSLSIVKNYDALRFIIIDSGGAERNVNVPIGDWQAGEPRSVTATWDESTMTLFINGQEVGQNTLPNPLSFNTTTPIHIGSDFPGGQYVGASGTISNFTVYSRALAANELVR
jgi:hypothetical protein